MEFRVSWLKKKKTLPFYAYIKWIRFLFQERSHPTLAEGWIKRPTSCMTEPAPYISVVQLLCNAFEYGKLVQLTHSANVSNARDVTLHCKTDFPDFPVVSPSFCICFFEIWMDDTIVRVDIRILSPSPPGLNSFVLLNLIMNESNENKNLLPSFH